MAIKYNIQRPDNDISEFVGSFWFLKNFSSGDKEIIVIPDEEKNHEFSPDEILKLLAKSK